MQAVHERQGLVRAARQATWAASSYGITAVRVALRGKGEGRAAAARPGEERLAFVVGSPRSGTSFTGRALGSQPGWVDLGEVPVLKAAVPKLVHLSREEQAVAVRRILQRVRTLGLARGLRGVEQNPETSYVLAGALQAYPRATAVHVIRDGRDVVCSLLERGWLRTDRAEQDDAQQSYGAHARFWVETERRAEFEQASEVRRAAWAWRRYLTAARAVPERTVELRYEALVSDPDAEAHRLSAALDCDPAPLQRAFAEVRDRSVGRWRRDLTPEQLAEVESEAGGLLAELGYT
jgi:Sulfotransferase family